MAFSSGGRRKEPLHVVPMALALVIAAFTGGALGLVWQSAGLGEDDAQQEQAAEDEARLVGGADEEE